MGINIINSMSEYPIPVTLSTMIVDLGQVTNEINPALNMVKNKMYDDIGEIFDVYCVAIGIKPLAALDFTPYGRQKLGKKNKKLINKIIDFCNDKNVNYIHLYKKGGRYLKSIFFLSPNLQSAINLMHFLWVDAPEDTPPDYYQYFIGKSLGYSDVNIIHFIKEKLNMSLNSDIIESYYKKFTDTLIPIEAIYKADYNIRILDKINKIK
tara:strand:+ start:368 stop:994 length:627 start_codon:yes stop_codon:yes gene_type:complete